MFTRTVNFSSRINVRIRPHVSSFTILNGSKNGLSNLLQSDQVSNHLSILSAFRLFLFSGGDSVKSTRPVPVPYQKEGRSPNDTSDDLHFRSSFTNLEYLLPSQIPNSLGFLLSFLKRLTRFQKPSFCYYFLLFVLFPSHYSLNKSPHFVGGFLVQ